MVLAGALFGAGCDQGEPDIEPARGAPVAVVATYPVDGAGADCLPGAPADCGVRIDTPIELRFDSFLLPSSVNRQALAIYTGDPGNRVASFVFQDAPTPVYDVVERVVTFRLGQGEFFQPRTLYTVELVVPSEDSDFGFRAVDGAGLAQPVRFSFYTSGLSAEQLQDIPDPDEPPAEPEFSCSDILTWFSFATNQGQCAACHDDSSQVMGMQLQSGTGLRATVIGEVAHQTDLAGVTGASFENAPRFGIGMPRIDPKQPNNSYLLYKLLIDPDNYRRSPDDPETCQSAHRVAVGEGCLVPSTAEIQRLRNWFVLGDPMPAGAGSLYRSKLRGLQSWIRAGAECE